MRSSRQGYRLSVPERGRNGMTFSPIGFGNWIPVVIAGKRPKQGMDLISFNVSGDKPDHPSPKPIKAMKALIERLTKPDDIILDPFAGSGTTLVAAEEMGRRYLGFEISEQYCKIANRRLDAAKRQERLFTP